MNENEKIVMTMKNNLKWLLPFIIFYVAACAVLSPQVTDEAVPDLTFEELTANADPYIGRTVVMGGYVLQVRNQAHKSELVLLQAPLGMRQMPKDRDSARGRLILEYDGFLDPEVYTRGRKVTAGGRVRDAAQGDGSAESLPYVRLEVLDLHLWREQEYDPYWGYYGSIWIGPGSYYWGPYTDIPYSPRSDPRLIPRRER